MAWINPMPMGTTAAAGQSTDAMRLMMAKAYGSRGGRRSARKRGKKSKMKRALSAASKTSRKLGGRKLKFGSPAWRKKYMRKKR